MTLMGFDIPMKTIEIIGKRTIIHEQSVGRNPAGRL